MANVELTIAGRRYDLACRPGGEERLRQVAALVDARAADAARQMGGMSEARQMMFTALMLADEVHAAREAAAVPAEPDPAIAATIEALAERLERLCAATAPADAADEADGVEKPAGRA